MLAFNAAPPAAGAGPADALRSEAPASASAPRLRFGIAARIALGAVVLGIFTTASVSFFMYRGSIDILLDRQHQALGYSVGLAASRVATRFESAERDVNFLLKTPAVAGLVRAIANGGVDPVDGSSKAVLLDRVATLFSALIQARPGSFQARVLDQAGMEIVRVDRSADGVVTPMPVALLQDKADRPYFTATAKLPAGAIYVSDIDLNQEHGKVEVPHRPTARVATPLHDAAGRFIGILIINLDLKGLFDLVGQTLGAGTQYFVTNQAGDYLANSVDGGRAFGFDLGASYRLQDDFPEFAPLFAAGDATYATGVDRPAAAYLAYGQRIAFDAAHPDRFVAVAALLSNQGLLLRARQLANNTALIAVCVILAGVILAIFLARLIVRPLHTMTVAASHIAKGRHDIDLTDMAARTDETGELARAVSAMVVEITERERRLTAQAEELTRSNQELAQFAYVASHDLQEPLRMVGSYLELLSRRYEGKLDDEAQEFIGFAVDGATRMKRLINDLLGYSRAGNSPLRYETVEAGDDMVAEVLASLALHIEETHAGIKVGPLPRVRADPVQFGRVFQNLVENALKYRSARTPAIDVSAERIEGGWRFSVADNGIGIDPAFKDKIFEIFKRLHGRDRYPGTGIGLAVSKLVVERHGGRIWVEPAAGGGSVFYFTLPDARAA